MPLFMLTGTDPDTYENDRSLLVVADTREEAVEIWLQTYWQGDAVEFATFDPTILEGRPDGEHMTIWLVTVDPAVKGAIDYFSDRCKPVGYLAPSEN